MEQILKEAGQYLLEDFKRPGLKVYEKDDGSPVSEADYRVSEFLESALASDGIPVITEENYKMGQSVPDDYYLADPLDGTRYFLDGEPGFAVLLSRIEGGVPTMGAIYKPMEKSYYFAQKNKGAFLNGEKLQNQRQSKELTSYSSGFHKKDRGQALMAQFGITKVLEAPAIWKLCGLAESKADLFPRFGPTGEWDTAGAQVIVEEAGLQLLDVVTAQPMRYGKLHFLNRGFIACRNDLTETVQRFLEQRNAK